MPGTTRIGRPSQVASRSPRDGCSERRLYTNFWRLAPRVSTHPAKKSVAIAAAHAGEMSADLMRAAISGHQRQSMVITGARGRRTWGQRRGLVGVKGEG